MENKLKSVGSACQEIASQCIASRVRRLSRVITAIYDEALRPHGLTLNQLNILVFLSHIQKSRLTEVAQFLQMEISTASRNLERMRKAGWILVQEGKDARTREFTVSDKGQGKILHALSAWRKAQKRANSILGKKAADAMYAAVQNTT